MIPKIFVFVAYVVFYLFSMAADGQNKKTRSTILMLSCVVLAYLAGTRNPYLWADTPVYYDDFVLANDIFHYSLLDRPNGYVEGGYHFMVVIIKTFTDNPTVYFMVISLLTFFFLYKSLHRYSIYPMLGLCIYISRFMIGRNMMQIRSCIAIVIIISFTYLVREKKWWAYFLVLLLCYNLHHTAIVAAPLLLLGVLGYHISKKQIYYGLLISFVIAQYFGGFVKAWVTSSDYIMNMADSYLQEGSEKAFSNDLTNPVIWFQTIVLLIFTYYEDRFKKLTDYYYIYRNAYFMSTVMLIVLCQYAVVAARTSTLFATFECMIIPFFLTLFKKNERSVPYAIIGAGLILLFILNFPSAITHIWYIN